MKARSARQPLLAASDLKKAAMFASGLPVAWLLPARIWPPITRVASRLPPVKARVSGPLPPGLVDLLGGDQKRALARLQGAYFEDCLLTLREWAPWRARQLRVGLVGVEHLEEALSGGRGAIIWVADLMFMSLVGKAALRQAGHPTAQLTRETHRFSATRLGRRFLNPIATRVEDRYMARRVLINEANPSAATLRLRRLLSENRVVSISAGGPAAQTVEAPFFGSKLTLPVGALRLGLISGAPVLPMYLQRLGSDRFEGVIEPAFRPGATAARAHSYQLAAAAFVEGLERCLRQDARLWAGWQR